MIEVQYTQQAPKEFHYCWRREGTESETAAKDYLIRQGCTLVIHCDDGISYGVVEPADVVRQRSRAPRYD